MTTYQEEEECIELPPGFRFHPTDEEIITHYLLPKVANAGAFAAIAIGEVDLNKCEPWELPSKAKMEGKKKEWYFYCRRDRKYPTGTRANRATAAGFWKATGKDREIFRGRGVLVGMRKTLVFYRGRAPKGEKTNWVIHEYRLEGGGGGASIFSALPKSGKEEWVVCRVTQKGGGGVEKGSSSTVPPSCVERIRSSENSFLLPPLMVDTPLSSFSNRKLEGFDDLAAVMNGNPAASSYSPLEPVQSWQYNYSSYLQQQETPSAMTRPRKNIYPTQQGTKQIASSQELTGRRSTTDHNTEISSVVFSLGCGPSGGAGAGSLLDLENVWFKYS